MNYQFCFDCKKRECICVIPKSLMTQEQVIEAIKQEWVAIRQWEKLAEEKVKYHREQIRLLQKYHCKHEDTKYHPDPSGNNDSYYECLTCGIEGKRLP